MAKKTHLIVGPKEEGNPAFGEVMRQLRDKAKLTRAEAADKLDLSSEYIRVIETGKRSPSLGAAQKMLHIYGVFYHTDKNVMTFDTFTVKFTSRIQEARRKTPDTSVDNRNTTIGEIVRLLVTVDDITLNDIHKTLRKA